MKKKENIKTMPTPKQWEKIRKEKQSRIDKSIDRREKSIAYFNSVNAAIQMVNSDKSIKDKKQKWTDALIEWRDWFYQEWKEWFLKETTPQPVNEEARKKGEEWQRKYNQDSELEEINEEAQLGAEKEAQDKIDF